MVLAGGLGLSTFTFSFLHTAMIRPLPLSDGDRIVRLSGLEDGRNRPVDVADVAALRASLRTLRELGGYGKREVMIGRDGETRVVSATVTEPVLFAVARTPARLGRTLLPADAEPGAEPVVVLSHRVWGLAFAASPTAIGEIVSINGVATRVVGIMPPGFGFPVAEEAWLPLSTTALTATRPGREAVSLFARLAPGVTAEQAAAEASVQLRHLIAARTPVGFDRRPRGRGGVVPRGPARRRVAAGVRPEMVPGYVFRASEVIEKSGMITVGLTKLFGACFAFALLLAVAGAYGLMSESIGLRTREIGASARRRHADRRARAPWCYGVTAIAGSCRSAAD